MPERAVSLFGGLAEGSIQAEEAPKVDCAEKDGMQACNFQTAQGKDSEGDQMIIACEARTDLVRVGHILRATLNQATLDETPQLTSRVIGEGVDMAFVADTSKSGENGVTIGTLKLSVFFAQNYSMSCWDGGSGGRKTFQRVMSSFLSSLKFKPHPVRPARLALGRVLRKGDRVRGMVYSYVQKREDGEPGSDETSVYFSLETDGKTWSHRDFLKYQFRDESGRIERASEVFSEDAEVGGELLAKIGENGKLRLKATFGAKSDSLESSPKEPLSSEIWLAPALLRLSKGEIATVKYSGLDFNEDSEPAFEFTTLTRKVPGVLLEEYASARKKTTEAARMQGKDELFLDDEGFVKKQVSTTQTTELVFKWGQLPPEAFGKGAKPGASLEPASKVAKPISNKLGRGK